MGRWAALLATTIIWASAQTTDPLNPKTSPDDVAAGGRIYGSHCAECHGRAGEGGRGPDLTRGEYRHGASDAALLGTIQRGVPGTEMPGIYLEEHQVWQVVSFVRSLGARPAPRSVAGDPERGRGLFDGKGGCIACHMAGGRGGRQGPDLSDIGGRRSPAHLRESLIEPEKEVRRPWWTYTVVSRDGATAVGFRLDEDTWSIRLLDTGGDLRSFAKSGLADIRVSRDSIMPSYAGVLAPGELDDIVAYLATLRRK